jgi:putative transposase
VQDISRKWTMPMQNWGIIIGQLMIFFEDRFKDLRSA